MRLSILLFLFLSLLVFTCCVNNEYIYLDSAQPNIRIDSLNVISMDSCRISVSISNEGGFTLKKAEIILEDITFDAITPKIYNVPLNSEKVQSFPEILR